MQSRGFTGCVWFGIAIACTASASPRVASASGVAVIVDGGDPARTLFPSDRFTVPDPTQNTYRRVALPKPDCAANALACEDLDVLNTLDGFNLQPRLTIPFDGAIDVGSVDSSTVFLVSLGSTLGGGSIGERIGIDQVVWDTATRTLHAQADELLQAHTRYVLVVTGGVRDATGAPIVRRAGGESARLVAEAAGALARAGRQHVAIAAIALFTTMSTTSVLEKIRRQLDAEMPQPARFDIGSHGERAVFPLSAVTSITFRRQITTAPAFATSALPLAVLQLAPGAIERVAFGEYTSPSYLLAGGSLPPIGTRTGTPVKQGTSTISFELFLPSGSRPARGWPVALVGHGLAASKESTPLFVAAKLAEQGIASIAISVVGHGGGSLGTLDVSTPGGTVTVSSGGRGLDRNGDGRIDPAEGVGAARPQGLLGSSDGLRQTVVDLMQLVRVIKIGIDVDGDLVADLDASRIYYVGQSFGGNYGTMLLAIEPSVRVGAVNVAGGTAIEVVRLSPTTRDTTFAGPAAARGLANLPPVNGVPQFDENQPLRGEPPVINNVPGAMALQEWIDRASWAARIGDPVSYARHVRRAALPGVPAKSILFLFAKGDQTVPNPTSTAILRAGALADRATFFRNDLAVAANPSTPRNPHTFFTNVGAGGLAPVVALQAQAQVAVFLASDGATTIDPDGAGPLFETPIAGPLPEDLGFLP